MTTRSQSIVRRRKGERGFALIAVIIAVSLVLLTLLVASTLAQLGSKLIALQLSNQGQALNVANSGLIEGLDYFRRQASQPVATFNPQRNLNASPPVDDTDTVTNPLSIRRDFLISTPGRVWGHYELVVGTSGNATTGTGVIDLSTNRLGSAAAAGGIWQLESTGIVYVKNGNVAYNVSPNQVLAKRTVRSEISRLQFTPPSSAISIGSTANGAAGAGVTINAQGRVIGGTGFGVNNTSGNTANAGVLSGTPGLQSGLTLTSLNLNNVFGGTINKLSDISTIADVVTTTEAGVPNPVQMQLIYLDKNPAIFTTPLKGSGVLVVNGSLTLPANSTWNGIIYVLGNYTQNSPSVVSGAVVVAGANPPASTAWAVIGSGTTDFADLYYDPAMINQIRKQLALYRFSRAGYIPCPATDPLCQKRLSGNRELGY
jgi:hypothetical protein